MPGRLIRPLPDETILPDNYPIYGDYLYVADGKVIRSDLMHGTVADLKRYLKAKELRRCDIQGRQKQLEENCSHGISTQKHCLECIG